MTKRFIRASLAAVSLAAAFVGASAQATPLRLDTALASSGDAQLIQAQNRGCFPGERSYDCQQRGRVEQRSNHHYVYRDGHYEDNSGNAAVGAILGFALGAAIAGSQQDRDYYSSHSSDRGWVGRCQSTYRSFDPRTGTYMGNDGYRHYCRK
jgi:hypothetical protein